MWLGLRVSLLGIALGVVMALLVGCGGSEHTTERERVSQAPLPSPPPTVGRRVGPAQIEPNEPAEVLSASPCPNTGENGTTTVPITCDIGHCAQVAPGGRLAFWNLTGFDGREGVLVRVKVGEYELRLRPRQRGVIPAPVRSYLGKGVHPVRVAGEGALGSTVWVLPPGCVLRPPAKPGEKLCFPRYAARLAGP